MKIPCVIDNQGQRLADVLNGIFGQHAGRSLDVATAYFTVGGFGLLRPGLETLGSLRLILGAEPASGEQLGLRPDAGVIKGLISHDLAELQFDEPTLRLVEDLIAHLSRSSVQVRLYDNGFLHAKCWLFYADAPGHPLQSDRFHPLAAIVGSSNFTAPGLCWNRELNVTHKVFLEPTEADDQDAARAVTWLGDPHARALPEAILPAGTGGRDEAKAQRALDGDARGPRAGGTEQKRNARWMATPALQGEQPALPGMLEAGGVDELLPVQREAQALPAEARQLLKSEVGARAIIDLEAWYERQWAESRDFKAELIELLDASKFGRKEYSPYDVYLKALYEYFKDELGEVLPGGTRSAIELAEFQEDAVKKARKILARYDGVMIADSVGLGKTWIGKKLLEDFAYHLRQKALVVCPASLREMWKRELAEATIPARVLSQEELGREDYDTSPFDNADVILIDESHNFRNRNAQRYGNLERLLGGNGGRGKDGSRKKVILLTATPVSNDLFDLYNQFSLITQGDRSYFSGAGIGDLYRYFLNARRESRRNAPGLALFNLLEEVVIRRTRHFIRKAYPEATIAGKRIYFPRRQLKTVEYNLEAAYKGIYDDIVEGVGSLELAPYNLEAYKKADVKVDEFEAGREQALVGIFKSRYLKRFESSIHAFRISVRRALAFLKTFESYILDGRLLRSSDFQKALRYLERESEEDDAVPESLADELDENEEARQVLETMAPVDTKFYDLRKLHKAVEHDVSVLTHIWERVKDIDPRHDTKLLRLKKLLSEDLKGQKVLIFTYYKDTARYLYSNLGSPENPQAARFLKQLGGINVRRMDSGNHPDERLRFVQAFAPKANGKPEWTGTDKEIQILISTDVLSEGQNLQDCGYLINYDLHWNPTRMVQRAGRIDRIGTDFNVLWIYNMFPDRGLERLLKLVESLNRKIADIDRIGLLDASVLGEEVHPRTFNTLKRIKDEDNSVIEEEEQFTELVSSEGLLQQLRGFLDSGGREQLDCLPDGIHSGLQRPGAHGVFFFYQARKGDQKLNFWKYCGLKTSTVLDNRHVLANLIACSPDTPRVVEQTAFKNVFELQEKVLAEILRGQEESAALQSAPQALDPLQQTVATVIQNHLNRPEVERKRAIASIKFLNNPMLRVQIAELRSLYKAYQANSSVAQLLDAIEAMETAFGGGGKAKPATPGPAAIKLRREDLRLICFDVLSP